MGLAQSLPRHQSPNSWKKKGCWTGRDGKSAKVAISIVLNVEEGSEMSVLNGDLTAESRIQELPPMKQKIEQRNLTSESLYDYGINVGFGRISEILKPYPVTVYLCGQCLEIEEFRVELVPKLKQLKEEAGWELSSHHYRWIDYAAMDSTKEKEHLQRTIDLHEEHFGHKPPGLYAGKPSTNTFELGMQLGFQFFYDSYSAEAPYYAEISHYEMALFVPYTLTYNDMCLVATNRPGSLSTWREEILDAIRVIVRESADDGIMRILSIGLHCRIAGYPHRAEAVRSLTNSIQELASRSEVCVITREEIANQWRAAASQKGVDSQNPKEKEKNAFANRWTYWIWTWILLGGLVIGPLLSPSGDLFWQNSLVTYVKTGHQDLWMTGMAVFLCLSLHLSISRVSLWYLVPVLFYLTLPFYLRLFSKIFPGEEEKGISQAILS